MLFWTSRYRFMMKTDRYYVQHMLDYALKLEALAAQTTRADYDSDETRQATYRYWLQVIGEAAGRVSHELREQWPAILWQPMIGMRNRIVHDYLGIDDDIVWKTVHERIPELVSELRLLMQSLPTNSEE